MNGSDHKDRVLIPDYQLRKKYGDFFATASNPTGGVTEDVYESLRSEDSPLQEYMVCNVHTALHTMLVPASHAASRMHTSVLCPAPASSPVALACRMSPRAAMASKVFWSAGTQSLFAAFSATW